MGLFNKKFDRDSFEMEDNSLSIPIASNNQAVNVAHSANAAHANPKRRHGYSIEDAIKLMRELPKDQRQMVVTIVQKTLNSANINVVDIIEDAGRKLSRLDNRSRQLGKEIEELEAGIAQRRQEIQTINTDMQETQLVKTSFEESIASPKKAEKAAHVPPPPEADSENSETVSASRKMPTPPVAV